MVSNAPSAPRYASFMADAEWKENEACRDMKPSLPNVLEVAASSFKGKDFDSNATNM